MCRPLDLKERGEELRLIHTNADKTAHLGKINHLTLSWSDIIKEDLMADAASFSYADASIGTALALFTINIRYCAKVLSDSSKRY